MSEGIFVVNGKAVRREVELTQEQIDYANRVLPIEELVSDKLREVAKEFSTEINALGVQPHDQHNWSNRDMVEVNAENTEKMLKFFELRQRHEDVKALIKSKTTPQELEAISWGE